MTEVGRVIGTEDAFPLEFWVGIGEGSYLQLDDIVAVDTQVPGRGDITLYGVVDMVRSKYEGAKFDTDVFRTDVLPVGIATAAHVSVTRIEPEIFVPPQPGQAARRAVDAERETALYFDQMKNRFATGLSREGDVIWGNLEFLDGTRGAHVNVSGISGVATKTSCAMFLLYSLFHSDALGANRHNARAVIFNVRDAAMRRRRVHGLRQRRPGCSRLSSDGHRSIATMSRPVEILIRLEMAKERQHALPSPTGRTETLPLIVVFRQTPQRPHAVNGGAAAKNFTLRQ